MKVRTLNPLSSRPALVGLIVAIFFAATMLLQATPGAGAHPLGNFTINRYSLIEVDSDELYVLYVLDMAEIPAFEEIDAIDSDGDGTISDSESEIYLDRTVPAIVSNLSLQVDGVPAELDVLESSLSFPEGQAGLKTLRLESYLVSEVGGGQHDIDYSDGNYSGRVGWQEVVVQEADSADLLSSTAPATDQSSRLTVYEESLLSSPLAVDAASFTTESNGGSEQASLGEEAGQTSTGAEVQRDVGNLGGFASLVSEQKLTLGFVLLALVLSAGWGAMHALGPGHGKTIVAAYLVGSRATARHAAFLGLTVTATHTSVVFALGLVTLYLSNYILPETLFLWLGVASGGTVVLLGSFLVFGRARTFLAERRSGWHAHSGVPHIHDEDEHERGHAHGEHGHDHDEEHGHSHMPPGVDAPLTWRSLLALGVSGGLIPCPSALLVMLAAITLDRVVFGLVLVTAFSVGLAGVLMAVGLLMVYGGKAIQRSNAFARVSSLLEGRQWALKALPVIAPVGVIIAGGIITYDALTRPGLFG